MKITVAGGSGFLGRALCKMLQNAEDEITVISRNPARARLPEGVRVISWGDPFPKCEALVNLAGASIAALPLTPLRMRALRDPRLKAIAALCEGYRCALPEVFVQASATGIYAQGCDCADDGPLDEGFRRDLIAPFEKAALHSFAPCRTALLRFGIIMGAGGGLMRITARLPRLKILPAPPGPLPWIGLEDAAAAIALTLKSPLSGVIAACNPRFKSANELLGCGKRGSFFLPLPRALLSLPFDRRGDLLLRSQRIMPQKLLEAGLAFHS